MKYFYFLTTLLLITSNASSSPLTGDNTSSTLRNNDSPYIDNFKAESSLELIVNGSINSTSVKSKSLVTEDKTLGGVRTINAKYSGATSPNDKAIVILNSANTNEIKEDTNKVNLDVNKDGNISSLDTLAITSLLNSKGATPFDNSKEQYGCDVNGDGYVTPQDALAVITYLSNNETSSFNLIDQQSPKSKSYLKVITTQRAGAKVDIIYDNTNDLQKINYSGFSGTALGNLANEFIISYSYTAIGDYKPINSPIIQVSVYSGSEDSMSICDGYLSDKYQTSNGVSTTSKSQMRIKFSDCKQKGREAADFKNIGALVFSILAEGRNILDFTLNQIAIDKITIMGPEDVVITDIGVLENPPILAPPVPVDPSPLSSSSSSAFPSPSSSTTAMYSPTTTPSPDVSPSASPSASQEVSPSASSSESSSVSPSQSSSVSPSSSQSARPSSSVSPSPSAIPTPECLFVVGWANQSGRGTGHTSQEMNDQRDIMDRLTITRTQPLPSCLFEKIRRKCGCGAGATQTPRILCGSAAYNITEDNSVKIWGDCQFGNKFQFSADAEQNELATYLGVPPPIRNLFVVPPATRGADAPYWYFDKNCNAVSPPANSQVCGYAGASWSPISLILDEEVGLEEDIPVAEFNLSGTDKKEYVLWKGSGSAPLVIYDPEKTGKVTGAKQLFGNFALGGRTTDLKDYSKEGMREPWANGYQALSLFDLDSDGKLLGIELDSLSLWFDKNRNAISEEGEVKSMLEAGIKTIFYKNPEKKEDSKDVFLSVGFEREVKGDSGSKIKTGLSIDWFTETFSSKAEALSAISGIFRGGAASRGMLLDNNSTENKRDEKSEFLSKPKGRIGNHIENISGYWVWTILEKGADKNPGLFVLSENQDGTIDGYTIAESVLAKNRKKIRSSMFAVKGSGSIQRSGVNNVIKMKFTDTKAGGESIVTAKLSKDGTSLKGVSKQSFEIKVGEKIKSTSVTYKWVATKSDVR